MPSAAPVSWRWGSNPQGGSQRGRDRPQSAPAQGIGGAVEQVQPASAPAFVLQWPSTLYSLRRFPLPVIQRGFAAKQQGRRRKPIVRPTPAFVRMRTTAPDAMLAVWNVRPAGRAVSFRDEGTLG